MQPCNLLGVLVLVCAAAAASPSLLRFEDLQPALKIFLPGINTPGEFQPMQDRLVLETEQRLHDGDSEALVYYVLQAKRFTAQPAIEPALAARQYVEKGTTPAGVDHRIADFATACEKPNTDERLDYFCQVGHNGSTMRLDYSRAMRFLYEKEFTSRAREGDERREFVASLYQTRGLSTDSSFDANFPIYLALKGLSERRLEKVLIIGPGLDFAPRTGLNDSIPPQSLQPFAVADALLQLRMSSSDRLRIDCVDVNPRVVQYFEKRPARRLTVFARPGTEEYQQYFNEFGRGIGKASSTDGVKTVDVSREVAGLITAARLNVLTEHYYPPAYDLVIATNVLVYFKTAEVALAFANVRCMLREGGFFLHNDLRGEIDMIGRAVNMPVVDARMLRLREDERRSIFDNYVIHLKGSEL